MKMIMRELVPAEHKYTYSMSREISLHTGCIGHLRADMGRSGEEFYSTWEDQDAERKTSEFKEELDAVINALRFDESYNGLLSNRRDLARYCHSHPHSLINVDRGEYGFRMDTERYAYLLRLNPQKDVYNLYCYCYEKKLLDWHIHTAEKGIRFIDSRYQEKFRIPDGDSIRITHSDGRREDRICYYIDDTHFEMVGGWNTLYHICQFAEQMEQMKSTVIPLRSSLPTRCYAMLPGSRDIVQIRKGETGYNLTSVDAGSRESNAAIVNEYNQAFGITKAQEQAMLCGSLFGWQVHGADPQTYEESERILKPKTKVYEQER